jgi:septal ring factor EnvC (AmiA/AmiB activator)
MEANNISATCVAHRRDCLERHGYWDETLPRNGDWELWGRIIRSGGEQNFAHDPTPTSLHFRAIWKTDTTLGSPELYQWRDLRAYGTLPTDYPTVPTAPGEPEQATAWRALAADPDGEVARIRREVVVALDLVAARTDLLLTVPYQAGVIAQLQGEIAARDGATAAASRHIAGLERLIGDKDRHIANLEGFLRERDARIVQHEADNAAQAHQLVSMEEECASLGQQVISLEERRILFEQQIAHLEAQRALLGQQIADQQAQVASGNQSLLDLTRELAEIRRILADRERHIARFEGRWPLRLYRRFRRLAH